jgi:hypothetical protein
VTDIDARLWHPWLRINRVLRVMLHTRWSAEAWAVVRVEFRALALRERDSARGLVQLSASRRNVVLLHSATTCSEPRGGRARKIAELRGASAGRFPSRWGHHEKTPELTRFRAQLRDAVVKPGNTLKSSKTPFNSAASGAAE